MRIAVFIFGLTGGGATRRTLDLAEGFAARGHEVDLVVVDDTGPLRDAIPSGVRLVNLSRRPGTGRLCRFGKRRQRIYSSRPALAGWLREVRPDCLLSAATHTNLAALAARRLARTGTPLVIRVGNHLTASLGRSRRLDKRVRYLATRRTYRAADAVIAVSAGIAEDLVRNVGIDRERVSVIYNPVFRPEMIAKAQVPVDHTWFRDSSVPVILGAGRLSPQKDFMTLLQAFSLLRRRRPARLVILGEGKERGRLEEAVREFGLVRHVHLPGYVTNPLPWMARASVFCLSSRYEGLPGVLIEAMAVGCPVVSTDCPSGPSEILESGRYGKLVPPGDPRALAEALEATLQERPERERLMARASWFSVEKAVNGYLRVLQGAAGTAPSLVAGNVALSH